MPTEREGDGTWAKLRRRKVVQWGLAHAAGSWALMQAISHLVATFHWPEHVQQISTIVLVAGLPIALVLAWYHGERGQQRVSASEMALLALLIGARARFTPAASAPGARKPFRERRGVSDAAAAS